MNNRKTFYASAISLGVFAFAQSASAQVGIILEGSPDDPGAQQKLEDVRQAGINPNAHRLSTFLWTATATDGGGIARGDARTLTWGFVPDGTTISSGVGPPEVAGPSSLIAFLDTQYATAGGTGANQDYSGRSWYSEFDSPFERMEALSGLTLTYTAFDDGDTGGGGINNASGNNGLVGTRADVRIGGHSIDGQTGSNTLAYNYFPTNGDMVIDTDNTGFYTSINSLGFRNVVAHEHGHGLGMSHVEPISQTKLMEPFISTAYDGPQIDDVLALHRGYGDVNEKSNAGAGNDISGNATPLGAAAVLGSPIAATVSVGADGTKTPGLVLPTDVNFVSIDGTSDTDYFSFTVSGPSTVNLTLTPVGATYLEGPQNGIPGDEVSYNASELSDLELELFDTDGTTSLGLAQAGGVGIAESLTSISLAAGGTYFARVGSQGGATDEVQLYQLDVSAMLIPEPSSAVLLALSALGLIGRRRRG